jgi:hypothetical protein
MDVDSKRDPGQVFTIPDLFAPSAWLRDAQPPPGLLFSGLTLDGS